VFRGGGGIPHVYVLHRYERWDGDKYLKMGLDMEICTGHSFRKWTRTRDVLGVKWVRRRRDGYGEGIKTPGGQPTCVAIKGEEHRK